MIDEKKKILFVGGGTVGPVTPLLAIWHQLRLKHDSCEPIWVGTKHGPERELLANESIPFFSINAAKIDRFFSFRNILAPLMFIWSLFDAFFLIRRVKPDLLVAAGAFVAVPLVIVARLCRVPILIHQLDVRPGLANKIMAPFASIITVTFEKTLAAFNHKKTFLTGAPVRPAITRPAAKSLPIREDLPLLLVFGGGTGARAINELIMNALSELTAHYQVLHITGKQKLDKRYVDEASKNNNYLVREFLSEEMPYALQRADLVVTRAGLGTMLELAALKKPAIIIPIPDSHQEDNARILADAKAAIVLDQKRLSPQEFATVIIKLLADDVARARLSQNIAGFYQEEAINLIIEKIEALLYNIKSDKE